MQSSSLLLNLHQVAMKEGHLPKHWSIGADNTRKETKNQITMWMLVWLLCALEDTPLWMIDVIFLMVGAHPQQTGSFCFSNFRGFGGP